MKRILFALTAVLIAPAAATASTEYFVAVGGDDTASGTSIGSAFATVQRGVDALSPGDVLTIAPGEYHEAVARVGLGSDAAETLIRAQIPGTVLLRGDVPAPEFELASGYRFVWQAKFDGPVQAVNELDTLLILEAAPSVAELEFSPGRFHHDAERGILYISTTDFQPPPTHAYSVAVLEGRGGIFLQHANRVTVEGLTVTGFNSAVPLPRLRGGNSISDVIPWGIFLSQCTHSVIRNCTAFLNAGGLAIQSGTNGSDNRIEQSLAFGNQSTRGSSGGNITVFNPHRDEVRESVAFLGQQHGIRMHGGSPDPIAVFADNLSWGHRGADFQLKTEGAVENASARRCITPDKSIILGSPATLARDIVQSLTRTGNVQPGDNIVLGEARGLDMNAEFADPLNMDFRLQSTSRFRGAGESGADLGPHPYTGAVYFVSPQGSDAADGRSFASAWRTAEHALANINSGDTLYLEEGSYTISSPLRLKGTAAEPVTVRGRGHGVAVLTGAVTIENSAHLVVERLEFRDSVTVRSSESVAFHNCAFAGNTAALSLNAVSGARLTRCLFSGFRDAALRIDGSSGVFLQANIFDNTSAPAVVLDSPAAIAYSDFNSFSRPTAVWLQNGATLSLRQVQLHADVNSVAIAADFNSARLLPGPRNALQFHHVSPLGPQLGFYNETVVDEAKLKFIGPFLHSASATTANIEWWASEIETFTVEWGTTPEYGHRQQLVSSPAYHPGDPRESYSTFSLQGLAPATKYYARVLLGDTELGTLSFTTLARDPAPRSLHVAVDGDDANDGLSPTAAFRTLTHAAAKARPGDVVMVGTGVYHEFVRIRATGDEGRPITFRSAPGAKVVLDGDDRTLYGAFSIANKGHIVIDGFYFENFQRMNNQGVIRINGANDIQVQRCFYNGRGGGSPEFITIGRSRDILVKNCVMISGWDGIAAGRSHSVVIENCVIVRPSIRSIPLSAPTDVVIRNNIVSDNLAGKRGAFLVQDTDGSTVEGNCFFLRWPEQERPVFGREGRTLADYEAARQISTPNLLRDPKFSGVVAAELLSADGLFLDGSLRAMTDFDDLFATDEVLIKRDIGLQPEAFADFHFNSN